MAIYKLGEIIINITAGGDMPKDSSKNMADEYIYPIIGNGTIGNEILGYSKNYKISNAITISARGTIGEVKYRDYPFTPIVRLLSVIPNEEIVLTKYLEIILIRANFQSTGAVQKQLTKPMLEEMHLEIPSIKAQKELIDIIKPIEMAISELNDILSTMLGIVKNMVPIGKIKFKDAAILIKNKPKNINQVSAKILEKRNPLIKKYEMPNTYKTNSFFAPKGTLVINTIRTYLEKFGILYEDADVNGTLAQFNVDDKYESTILKALLNNDFWSIATKMSHGTKMPVIKKQDILDIEIELIEPIDDLFNAIISINSAIKLNEQIKLKIISLLIK